LAVKKTQGITSQTFSDILGKNKFSEMCMQGYAEEITDYKELNVTSAKNQFQFVGSVSAQET
jgi:hypothetical protein